MVVIKHTILDFKTFFVVNLGSKMTDLNTSTLQAIGMQSILLNEISRSILFSRKLDGEASESKRFIKSSLLKQSVIVWCQVFGSCSEDLHWSRVAPEQSFVKPFDRDNILEVTGFTLDEWSKYHKTLKHLRDKYFAHFDMDGFSTQIPCMDHALTITEAYRDWLYEMLLEAMKSNPIHIRFVKTKEFNKTIEREWEP